MTTRTAQALMLQFGGRLLTLCCAVQTLVIDIAYEFGIHGLSGYPKMLTSIASGDWERAAVQ